MKQALLKQTMEMLSKLETKPEDGKQRGGRHGRNKAGPMGQGALPSMQEQLAQQREGGDWCIVWEFSGTLLVA